jgi:hypothetical protein
VRTQDFFLPSLRIRNRLFSLDRNVAEQAAMVTAISSLILLLLVAFLLAATIVFILGKGRRRTLPTALKWAIALAGLVLFVYVGAAVLNTVTDRKAAPSETIPWLTIIGLAVALFWLRPRNGFFTRKSSVGAVAAQQRSSAENDTLPAAPRSGSSGPLIFISYRRNESSDVTGRIYDRLINHYRKESIFKDVDSIPLGVDFRKRLADSVGQCRVLLAIIGKDWLGAEGGGRLDDPRDFVRIEIESALERNIPIVPLLVQGARMPREEDLPRSLQALVYYNAISIRPDPDFHQDMTRLIKGLETHLHAGQ